MAAVDNIALERIDGSAASLSDFAGKALLVVNVASKCGLTSQYEGLEALHAHYKEQGLEVLGFPANDFLGQEPGSNEDIQEFCRGTFGVQFPMFSKITVLGGDKHPLYKALIDEAPGKQWAEGSGFKEKMADKGLLPDDESEVSWNFEKFLLDRDHRVIARFAPDVTPDAEVLVKAVKEALQ
ncbi:glutathione peroxidase [Carnimonas bestiolae]|uniref:glutathione peroxidase n=1 Tax=Carnimonas bestiolae TaxID=3402172 RepID=UPI003EDC4D8E